MAHAIRYKSLNVSQAYRLRGTYQQTDTGMLGLNPVTAAPATTGAGGVTPTAIAERSVGLAIGFCQLTLRNGVAQSAGIIAGMGGRIPNRLWQAGTWTDATTLFTVQPSLQ